MKEPIENKELSTWDNLNEAVMKADEEKCYSLIEEEKRGRCRKMFLLRIHSRLNKIRADRERKELVGPSFKG